jgi:hypothetical protein
MVFPALSVVVTTDPLADDPPLTVDVMVFPALFVVVTTTPPTTTAEGG